MKKVIAALILFGIFGSAFAQQRCWQQPIPGTINYYIQCTPK